MKNATRALVLFGGDSVALGCAFAVMLSVAFRGDLSIEILRLHALPFLVVGALWLTILFMWNLYALQAIRLTIPRLKTICAAFLSAMLASAIFFYTLPAVNIAPKTNLLIFGCAGLAFFLFWRRLFYNIFSSRFRKSVAFIAGGGGEAERVRELAQYIGAYPQSGFTVFGTYASLEEFSHARTGAWPEMLILSRAIWRSPEHFKTLYAAPCEILDLAYAYEDLLGRIPVEAIDEDWFMHNIDFRRRSGYEIVKRILSIGAAFLIFVLTLPLTLITALSIKLSDRGPVFYSQLRVGKGDRPFRLYKFRSMIVDAEKEGPRWSSPDDERVTGIGTILRRLHLDELPQMWNVLRGDLALVVPRPERPEFVGELEKTIPFYHLRHVIAPGFTGWAQIKFRYARTVMDSREKFEYDLYYLKNRNIFMDLGILIRTTQIIFTH